MTRISNRHGLTASAIRKLRNAAKANRKAQQEALNSASLDCLKAREGQDDIKKGVRVVLQSAGAFRSLCSSTSRDRLKGGTYGQGFLGPRGFATPKGLVSRAENTPGQLAGRDVGKPLPAPRSKPFALDGFAVDKAGEGSVQRLSAPFKPKGATKTRRQWMTVNLNDSAPAPTDQALTGTTDRAARDARTEALSKGQSLTFKHKLRKA